MKYELLTGETGVAIVDVDLASVSDEEIDEIRGLVAAHCVAVFPDQHIHPTDQVAFAKRLGSLLWTPGEVENTEWPDVLQFTNEGAELHRTGVFHTDTCFVPEPPSFTILSSVEAPEHGGDTLFSNQYVAYEQLSDRFKELLAGARVKHVASGLAQPEHAPEPVWHPAVRRHPVTGRPALFTTMPVRNPEIEGMTLDESALIIEYLYAQAHNIDRIYRHRWSTGDVVMWDNRCTQHAVVHDHGVQPRTMNRVMVSGEVPVAA